MTFSHGKSRGFGQKARTSMEAREAKAAILQYKGEHFKSIDDLLKKVNQDNKNELSRAVARTVLNSMDVNSTKPFTIT